MKRTVLQSDYKKRIFLPVLFAFNLLAGCRSQHNLITGPVNRGVDSTTTNTYVVDYNFQTGTYVNNMLKIKVNTPTAFKVSNVNRMAYDVNVTSKDSILAQTYFFDSPTGFFTFASQIRNSLLMKADGAVETPQTGKDITTINNDDISKKATENVKDEIEKRKIIDSVTRDVRRVDSFIVLSRDTAELTSVLKKLILDTSIIAERIKEFDSLNSRIAALNAILSDSINRQKQFFIDSLSNLQTAKNKINIESLREVQLANKNELKKKDSMLVEKTSALLRLSAIKIFALAKFQKDFEKFSGAFEKLKRSYNNSENAVGVFKQVMAAASNPELTLSQYQSKYQAKFEEMGNRLDLTRNAISQFKLLYADLEILYHYMKYNPGLDDVLDYGGQIKLYAHADYLKTVADNMNSRAKEIDFEEMIIKTEQVIGFLGTPNAYNIIFSPVQPFNDMVVFDVSINKKEKNASDFYNTRNFKHREFTYGGSRLDFSIGLAGSFFKNTPVYELSVKDKNDASTITIQEKDNNLFVPSLVGMATMSYRKTGYMTFGASAGLGIDVTNGKIQLSNFLGGPSMIFGKYDRLTLTAGAAIRNVGKLKPGYEVGQTVSGTADDIKNFITDKYKAGVFMSLTYNFTKGVKDNIKQLK